MKYLTIAAATVALGAASTTTVHAAPVKCKITGVNIIEEKVNEVPTYYSSLDDWDVTVTAERSVEYRMACVGRSRGQVKRASLVNRQREFVSGTDSNARSLDAARAEALRSLGGTRRGVGDIVRAQVNLKRYGY